jgi:hypothetical protein
LFKLDDAPERLGSLEHSGHELFFQAFNFLKRNHFFFLSLSVSSEEWFLFWALAMYLRFSAQRDAPQVCLHRQHDAPPTLHARARAVLHSGVSDAVPSRFHFSNLKVQLEDFQK